jgi:two-component system chemotaxis sensor kinase CheA
MDKDMVDGFLEEAEDLFNSAIDLCLKAETDGNLDEDDMAALFRDVHTLKGSSSVVDLVFFPKYVHNIETFMDNLRKNNIEYQEEMSDFLLGTFDIMRDLLSMEVEEELNDEIFEEMTIESTQKALSYIDNKKTTESTTEKVSSQDDLDLDAMILAELSKKKKRKISVDKMPEGFKSTKVSGVDKKEEVKKPIKEKKISNSANETSIRVNLEKIDKLMNQVGNLVITNSMLLELNEYITETVLKKKFEEKLQLLDREIRSLQDAVMNIRMVPMETIYRKFPKMIRDVSKKLDKKIEFVHTGDTVEIDKSTIEGLNDPLMHIIRNSLDHGIESKEVRLRSGKSDIGKIEIGAEASNGQIVISIKDDGGGINVEKVVEKALENNVINEKEANSMTHNEKAMLIFAAGLSTAEEVSDISGRGVGMDVVKTNIENLGGKIKIKTEDTVGTTLDISLPLTLAILDGLNIKVGKEIYIIPLNLIIETLQPKEEEIRTVGSGKTSFLRLRKENIPIINLYDILDIDGAITNYQKGIILIIGGGSHKKVAIFVDEFLNKQQFVVKPLEKNFTKIKGFSGATIKGNGSVSLIMDPFSFDEYEEITKKTDIKED